jgi:hypothetical protein
MRRSFDVSEFYYFYINIQRTIGIGFEFDVCADSEFGVLGEVNIVCLHGKVKE